jgi:inosine-uridine nucleoside N-ribohydrolase
MPHAPHTIFLDTDVGTDIDDAYALLLAAVSPELELVGVGTVNNDTVLRARIARKLLKLLGRPEIPVVAGRGEPYTEGISLGWMGHEGEGIDLSDPSLQPDKTPLPEMFTRCVEECHHRNQPLMLVTIGAMTNAAWLLEALPAETAGKIGRIVAMASTWEGYGDSCAAREHNVACDTDAFDRVLKSGIPLTLVGLNVTRRTAMTAAQLQEIEAIGGPLAEALSGMHRVWFREIGRESSPMHDALAIAALFRPSVITTAPVAARVLDRDGTVLYNTPAPGEVTHIEIAIDVDVEAYHALLWERTLEAVRANKEIGKETAGWGDF